MSNPKYELRSEQAEGLLNKTPHSLIMWGNALILGVLAAGIFFLGNIDLAQYQTVPVIVRTSGAGRIDRPIELALQLHRRPDSLDGTLVTVQFGHLGSNREEILQAKIVAVQTLDSVDYILKVQPLGPARTSGITAAPDSGQVCSAKIRTGKTSIGRMIRQQLNRMIKHQP